MFGSATQVLPSSNIRKKLSSFLITAVVVFISMLISFIENYIFLTLLNLANKISLYVMLKTYPLSEPLVTGLAPGET